jgi:hypothetical protein
METTSCEYVGQQRAMLLNWLKKQGKPHEETRECGLCFPCLIRRSALEVAGVREPTGHYVFDARIALKDPRAYDGAPLYDHVASRVKDLREFTQRIERMEPNEFALNYLGDLSFIPSSPEDVGQTAGETYSLYRRFARQFTEYLSD